MNPETTPVEILLVEDEPASVRIVREALKGNRLALHMSVAPDGEQALAIVRRQGCYANAAVPHLILLDLHLPKMDGFSVLDALRHDTALKYIPVVVLTTSSAPADIQQSYALGANAYVVKPRSLVQVIALINSIMEFWCVAVKLPYAPVPGTDTYTRPSWQIGDVRPSA